MRPRRGESELLAYIFNRRSDLGLLVGAFGFVLLLIGWSQEWPTAYAWVFPGVMGGSIVACVVARRYAPRPD